VLGRGKFSVNNSRDSYDTKIIVFCILISMTFAVEKCFINNERNIDTERKKGESTGEKKDKYKSQPINNLKFCLLFVLQNVKLSQLSRLSCI